jgi:hypothetical protein
MCTQICVAQTCLGIYLVLSEAVADGNPDSRVILATPTGSVSRDKTALHFRSLITVLDKVSFTVGIIKSFNEGIAQFRSDAKQQEGRDSRTTI